jgi:methionyl-tRNA synthetase
MNLRIPNHVLGHGWIMAEDGRKMSKSFGNVVNPNELLDLFGSDATRYYFMKEFSYQNDNNFSHKKFKEIFNADLSNIFGNIVNRTIGMLKLYRNGIVYKPKSYDENSHINTEKNKLLKNCERIVKEFNIKQLVEEIVEFGKSINKYIEDAKP